MRKLLTKFRSRYFVLFALLTLTACEREDAIEEVNNDLRLETVSIEEAKQILSDAFPKTKSGVGSFPIIPDLKNISQQSFVDSEKKITIVPASISGDSGYNRIFIFKLNGKIRKQVCSMYADKQFKNANLFSGIILMRNFDGSFREAARFSEDKMVSIFLKKPTTKSFSTDKIRFHLGGVAKTDEIDRDLKNVSQYLDEVIIIGKRTPTPKRAPMTEDDGGSFLKPNVPERENHSLAEWNFTPAQPYPSGGGYTPPKPKVDDKGLENTKAECIKEALEAGGSNSLLNKLLAGFKLENSPIDITYKVQDKVFSKKGDEVNGLCRHNPNTNKITIFLSKTRMQTQSFLETARTILHETFHAHLYGMIKTKDNTTFNTISDADGLDFRTTWDKYIKLHPKQTQHNWMAERYIGLMKKGLSKLYEQWDDADRSRFEAYAGVTDTNRDFMFESIAWHGLLGKNHDMTEAGKEFYTKKGAEYEKMKDEVIRYLGKNCPNN